MKITLRVVISWIVAALAIAAFIVSFSAGIVGKLAGVLTNFKGLAFGKQTTIITTSAGTFETATEGPIPSLLSRIAVILILVGGVFAALAATFKTHFGKKGLLIFAAVIILVGAIMMLFTKEGWIESQIQQMIKEGSLKEANADNAREGFNKVYESFKNNSGTIFTAILGFLAAIGSLFAAFSKKR